MNYIYTIAEAEDWFLSNHTGSVVCVNKNREEKVVDCYPDAAKFLKEDK